MSGGRVIAALAGLAALGLFLGRDERSDGGRRQSGGPECPPPGSRVLLVGDSLAVGLGPPMAELAADCGTPFAHRGKVGQHVTELNASWSLPPSAGWTDVLISMGGNDYQHNDPDAVALAIVQVLQKIRQAGARPWWIAPPPMPIHDAIDVRGMWRIGIAGRGSTGYAEPWVDYFPTDQVAIPQAPDQIHPTPEGYRLLAALIWEWLAERTA